MNDYDIFVRVRRKDREDVFLRIPAEHLQRVMDLANGEFGDKSIVLDGPEPAQEK